MEIKSLSVFFVFFLKIHVFVGFTLFANLDLEILFEVWRFQSSLQKAEAAVTGMRASFPSQEKSGANINIVMY